MASWPKTYQFLAECNDASVDEVLAVAMRQLDGPYLHYVVEVLLHRAQAAGLLALIENFHRLPDALKGQVLAGESALASVMRTAIRDIEAQTRVNCLEIASQMGSESLAYLFDLGLMDTQAKVRESAALMMRQMARKLLADHPLLGVPDRPRAPAACPEGHGDSTARLAHRRHQMVEALLSGTLRYESHFRTEVVEACMWFEPYLGAKFREMYQHPRSRLPRLMNDLAASSHEPQAASFLVQSLASPNLRPSALKAITERRDVTWFQGILRGIEIWSPCPKVRKAWAFIKTINCLQTMAEDCWPQLARSFALPVLISASNLPREYKAEVMPRLWYAGTPDCRRQVLLEAGHSETLGVPVLRTALVESQDPYEARTAAFQLRRLNYEGLAGDLTRRLSTPGDPTAAHLSLLATDEIFFRLWERFDLMHESRRVTVLAVLKDFARQFKVRLRVNLASISSSARVRSVRMVGMLGLVDELWQDVLAVAQDQNSRPRSAAVRLLGRSNRPEMVRQLRSALDDSDSRVQANAIEAIDEAAWPDRLELILPKLHSGNNRVAANAAKTLARTGDEKASEVLLSMLQDHRVAYRTTAIWTIKTIGAHSWIDQLKDLATTDPSPIVRRMASSVAEPSPEPTLPTTGEYYAASDPSPTEQPVLSPSANPSSPAFRNAPDSQPPGVKRVTTHAAENTR